MKNLIFILCGFCLFFYSCNKKDLCFDFYTEKPTDLKSIDYEKYNDVYTVYWNYVKYCDEINRSMQDREFVYNRNNYEINPNKGDSLKVWGWITGYSIPSTGQFFIHSHIQGSSKRRSISVFLPVHVANELAMKLVNITFPVKCFISGEVLLPCLEEGSCRNKVTVSLYVNDVNNVYFEE